MTLDPLQTARECGAIIVTTWAGHPEATTVRFAPDQLAAFVSRVSAPDGWISVDERLPDNEEMVFAFWPPRLAIEINDGCWGCATYTRGMWRNPEDEDDLYTSPTHWRHLPAPPSPAALAQKAHEQEGGPTSGASGL